MQLPPHHAHPIAADLAQALMDNDQHEEDGGWRMWMWLFMPTYLLVPDTAVGAAAAADADVNTNDRATVVNTYMARMMAHHHHLNMPTMDTMGAQVSTAADT